MNEQAAERRLGELWHQVNRELHDRFRQAFRSHELPPMALMVLRQIHREPGVSVSELARRSGTVKSHVSKMVEHLVRQGHLEKRPDPDDQRLLRVYMTGPAVEMMAELETRAHAVWDEVMAQVDPAELPGLQHSLQVLLIALGRSRPRDTEREPSDTELDGAERVDKERVTIDAEQ